MIKLNKRYFLYTLDKVYNLYKNNYRIEEGKTWHDYWNITDNFTKINDEYNILYYLKDCELFRLIKKCII
jgi:hypothetical protein